jgi:hypothetical protein
LLHKAESIVNRALITREKQATLIDRFALPTFFVGDFRAKGYTLTPDSSNCGPAEMSEIRTRIGLPDVSCEGAAILSLTVGKVKIIVFLEIVRKGRIILKRGDINWGTCVRM